MNSPDSSYILSLCDPLRPAGCALPRVAAPHCSKMWWIIQSLNAVSLRPSIWQRHSFGAIYINRSFPELQIFGLFFFFLGLHANGRFFLSRTSHLRRRLEGEHPCIEAERPRPWIPMSAADCEQMAVHRRRRLRDTSQSQEAVSATGEASKHSGIGLRRRTPQELFVGRSGCARQVLSAGEYEFTPRSGDEWSGLYPLITYTSPSCAASKGAEVAGQPSIVSQLPSPAGLNASRPKSPQR